MAFMVAGAMAVITLVLCVLEVLAAGMSDAGGSNADVAARVPWHFGIGMVCAAIVASIHWLHVGW